MTRPGQGVASGGWGAGPPETGWRELLEMLPDGYAIVDGAAVILEANGRLLDLVGYRAADLVGEPLGLLVPERHREACSGYFDRCLDDPEHRSEHVRRSLTICHRNGDEIAVDVSLSRVEVEERPCVLAAVRDTRPRVQPEERRESEDLFRQLFLRNAAGAFRVTLEGRLLECNDALANMLGYESARELEGRSAGSLYVTPAARKRWLAHIRRGGAAMNYEFQMRRKDGSVMWALENSILVDDPESGEPVVLGTVIDLSPHKLQQERLKKLAHHDSLTGLPNRRLLEERAGQVLALAERRRGRAALICCDLRRFKQINDAWGHGVGDEVLSQVADRLGTNTRSGDTVVRLGGDEFAILLATVKHEQDALQAARRLAGFLEEPFGVEGHSFQLDAAFGVALYPDDADNLDELLSCADHAMYQTTGTVRHEIQLYSEVATDGRKKLLAREEELRQALAGEQLRLAYQPIVRVETGGIVAAETLVRWNHPERGLLPASEFIAFAEYTGFIGELDRWVLREAVRQLGEAGAGPEWICLNLSASSLAHPELVAHISELVEEDRVAGHRLVVEITERVATRDPKAVAALLGVLGEVGVRVALDDFGVGHSSLSLLKTLPIHYLKVDPSFMTDVLHDERAGALVLGILGLGHGLGLEVIAEGVETREQLDWLRSVGCDFAQGYFTGHPGPAETVFGGG